MSWAKVRKINSDMSTPLDKLIKGQRAYVASDTVICVLKPDDKTEAGAEAGEYGLIGKIIPKISGVLRIFYKIEASASNTARIYYSVNNGDKNEIGGSSDDTVEKTYDMSVSAGSEYSFYTYSSSRPSHCKSLKIGAMITDTAQLEFTPYTEGV